MYMQRVYDFLKNAGVYYLATMDGDQPRVRPFGTVNLFEGKLYIQTGKVKPVSQQMQKNPKVEISAMGTDGRYIRLQAEVVRDDRMEPKTSMFAAFPDLRSMYDPADENTEVLYLKNALAQICAITGEVEEVRF